MKNALDSKSVTPVSQAVVDKDGSPAAVDMGRAGRLGLWALAIGFGGFLCWAALAPLDEGVPAHGVVALDTKRKGVQHLQGGIVKSVLVREGDEVKEGQPLMTLDSAVARANYEASRQTYLALLATQARLQTEQLDRSQIVWPNDLKEATSDPQIQQQVLNQEQLFNTRRNLLRSDLQSIQQSIQGQEALLQSYAGMLAQRKSQQALLNEELGHLRSLVSEGYAPRNQQLERERQAADIRSAIADLEGNTLRARAVIAELRQRVVSRQQEYRKEVETQLADVSRMVLAEGEKFRAVRNDLERVEIKSPASGQVVGLAMQTVGGVVQPGQKLMDIVPSGAPVLLEAKVPPHLIDRIKPGMLVDVRFGSFAHSPQLVVLGKVESISGDLVADPPTGGMQTMGPYYLARVELTPEGTKVLGRRQLYPGMPVEVIFKSGERSLLTYLLHPLTKRIAASMTEE